MKIGMNHVDKSTEMIHMYKVTFLNARLYFQQSLKQLLPCHFPGVTCRELRIF